MKYPAVELLKSLAKTLKKYQSSRFKHLSHNQILEMLYRVILDMDFTTFKKIFEHATAIGLDVEHNKVYNCFSKKIFILAYDYSHLEDENTNQTQLLSEFDSNRQFPRLEERSC